MRRRDVVRALAALPVALAGCSGALPGATGPRRPPEPSSPPPGTGSTLRVRDIDVEPGPDDVLRVLATVGNRGEEGATAELVATATVGDEQYVVSRQVDVPAGGEVEVALDFELGYDEFVGEGSVSVDVA